MHSDEMVVHTAEPDVLHFKATLMAMIRGVRISPYVSYRLVIKEIRAGYSKSFLGMFWDLADSLVLGCIFYLLMRHRVIQVGEMSTPYAIFVIYGLMLWATFVQSITMSVDLMRGSKGLLNQLKVVPEALLLSVFFRVLFDSMFRLAVMFLFSLIMFRSATADGLHALDAVGFMKFLLAYPVFILVGMSVGIFLAPFNVIFSDVGRLVKVTITPLRYITPVLWPIPNSGKFFSLINTVNPLTPFINGMRALATENVVPEMHKVLIGSACYGLLFLVGWFIFHVSVPVLAEKA